MKKWYWLGAAVAPVVLVSALFVAVPAMAGPDNGFKSRLSGYQEVPSISTAGRGSFRATLTGPTTLSYELKYSDLEGGVLGAVDEAHIHLGQRGTNGGVIAFLCGGLKPACPASVASPATAMVAGTIVPLDVLGPAGQGIAPGEFAELVRAMRAGAAYVNVHNSTYPSGEIRGQIDD